MAAAMVALVQPVWSVKNKNGRNLAEVEQRLQQTFKAQRLHLDLCRAAQKQSSSCTLSLTCDLDRIAVNRIHLDLPGSCLTAGMDP